MRVKCKFCGSKSRITSSDRISSEFSRLYCQCNDVRNCGHSFVMELGFSHSLTPPMNVVDQMVVERVRNMSSEQQQELFGSLGMQPA